MYSNIVRLASDINFKNVKVGDKEKAVANVRAAIKLTKDKSVFVNLTAWEHKAEILNKYYKKGDILYIEGELENDMLKIEEKEYKTVGITISKIEFTYGNKKEEDDKINV